MSSRHDSQLLNLAAIQQACSSDKAASLATTEKLVREAVANGANLVVLQELHATLYFCQTEDTDVFELAEPIPGPTSERLSSLAKELDVVLVGSIFERRMNGVYHNTAVVFESDGSLAGMYRKMHIPDDPGFYEKFYFTPAMPYSTMVAAASPQLRPLLANWACWCAGTSGTPRLRA